MHDTDEAPPRKPFPHWPLVRRSTMAHALADAAREQQRQTAESLQVLRQELNREHERKLNHERMRVDALVSKLTRVVVARPPDLSVYRIVTEFDERTMDSALDREIIAESLGRQVTIEILRAKFVERPDPLPPSRFPADRRRT